MKSIFFLLTAFVLTNNALAVHITNLSEIEENKEIITSIDLSNKGLTDFPIEILECKFLKTLNLSENGIINIPKELGNLKQLKTLDLSNNEGLSYVDLGIVFENALFRLKSLSLKNCEMGYLPTEIGKQNSIVNLNVSGNLLNNLPYSIIRMSKMERLDASNNRIKDISWQVHQWWKLKELNISANPTMKSEELVFALGTKGRLDYLSISHLQSIPTELKDLDVEELLISDSHIDRFLRTERSTRLRKLGFVNCTFSKADKVAETIEEFIKPEYLALNRIDTKYLNSFLKVAPKVDSINIRSNRLSNIDPLVKCENLVWLDARENTISEKSIETFKPYPKIKLMVSEPVEKMIGINPPIEKFAPKPVERVIEAGENMDVSLGNTIFSFKENSFLDSKGNVYRGEATIGYTEYRNPAEILFSGITMTIEENNETLPFSSAGMFNITAQDDNGNDLSVNPAAPVDVMMLRNNADTAVNVYVIDENGNWEDKGKDEILQPFKLDEDKVDSVGNAAFLNFREQQLIATENRYIPEIDLNSRERKFKLNFSALKTNNSYRKIQIMGENCYIKKPEGATRLIANTDLYYDGARDSLIHYKKFFNRIRRESRRAYGKYSGKRIFRLKSGSYNWGASYISNLDLRHDKTMDRFTLRFNYKDSLIKIPVLLSNELISQKKRIEKFAKFSQQLEKAKHNDEKRRRKIAFDFGKRMRKTQKEIVEMARLREENRQKAIYENIRELNGKATLGSVMSSFQIMQFGIWNCDQIARMNFPKSIPTTLVNGDHEIIRNTIERVSVVDHSLNGVLSYNKLKNVKYDRASRRTSIVVFFSGLTFGICHLWKQIKRDKDEVPNRALRLEIHDYSNLSTQEVMKIVNTPF